MGRAAAVYTGRVFSGLNNATGIVSDCTAAIRRDTGTDVVPGTLNVWLSRPVALDNRKAVSLGSPRFSLWPARLNGTPVWIFRHDRMVLHVAELVADRRLRAALDLCDGDSVDLAIDRDSAGRMPLLGWLAWSAFWLGRSRRRFVSPAYVARSKRWCRRLGATQDSVDASSARLLMALVREAVGRAR